MYLLTFQMLTAIFIDEWNVLAQVQASATPTVTFKLFNKVHSISFPDMAKVSVDMYMSIGGEFCLRCLYMYAKI